MSNPREAKVQDIEVQDVIIGSGFIIGDLKQYRPQAQVLAVQQEKPTFRTDPYAFEDYKIFQLPAEPHEILVDQNAHVDHHGSAIHVDSVHIKSVSTASLFEVGGIEEIYSQSRIKHIRALKNEQSR
ncbi:spore germination protein GerPE [Thalassobacillus sp. CUG 92003]|uniref:spore germination protein GerPE n=1 Tax=Thalassobacillus sp. CUG 92003 TaxID=2736641 RepID=UPI0015E68027|nr:spore germination protein GerPE [Thalassobacillus sp. CUG 92003]